MLSTILMENGGEDGESFDSVYCAFKDPASIGVSGSDEKRRFLRGPKQFGRSTITNVYPRPRTVKYIREARVKDSKN